MGSTASYGKTSQRGVVKAEDKVKKMEERIELAKTKIGAMLDAKDNSIQEIKKMVKQQ